MGFVHKPVLLWEIIEALAITPSGVYIDATLGGGGHALEIVKRLGDGFLVGIDRDCAAISRSRIALAQFLDRLRLVHANFADVPYIMETARITHVDGVLMDLGVSSFHLDTAERGFSYNHDGPLDMRMDTTTGLTAFEVVNTYSALDLAKIFLNYGEEKWSKRVADFVVACRTKNPIKTTFELVDIIKAAIPKNARRDGPHPAKRVFQAIRIHVNAELDILGQAVEDFARILRPGGKICIITFHSLEDRIVKRTLQKLANPCLCPRELPVCACEKRPVVRIETKKPITPGEDELSSNHRARSAKLRVATRV